MLVIANNITTRNARINRELHQLAVKNAASESLPAMVLPEMARQCVAAGADMLEIDLQQHHDLPEAMEFAVRAVQQATDRPLCLSTNNTEAAEAGMRACKHPPLVNFISIDGVRLQEMLPLIARYGAGVVLLVTDPAMPGDAQDMLKKAAIMVGAANEMGIPSDSILVDPGLFHLTTAIGQRHLVEVVEFLRAFPEVFDPPLRSTCWVSNVSAGVPKRLRPVIDTALLAMLSGLGLSSVFLDVLGRENMRMVRLLRALKNEAVYADGDIEL